MESKSIYDSYKCKCGSVVFSPGQPDWCPVCGDAGAFLELFDKVSDEYRARFYRNVPEDLITRAVELGLNVDNVISCAFSAEVDPIENLKAEVALKEQLRDDFARMVQLAKSKIDVRGRNQPYHLSEELNFAHMSARQFAKALGIDSHTVRRWCAERKVPLKFFKEVCDVIHRYAISGELRQRTERITRHGENRAEIGMPVMAALADEKGLQYIREENLRIAKQFEMYHVAENASP